MGFFLLLAYVALWYIRPGELWPLLAPYQTMFWVGWSGLIASGLQFLMSPGLTFRAPQIYLMPALVGVVAFSVAAQGWLGGAVKAFQAFGPSATVFFLIVFTVNSLRRLRILVLLVVLLSAALAVQGVLAYHYGYMADVLVLEQRTDTDHAVSDGSETVLRRIRSLGFLNDPNDLAQALVTALPFLGLAWRRGKWLRNLSLVLIPTSLVLYAVYLSRSRGGAFSLLVVVLLSLRKRLGRLGSILVTGVLAASLLAFDITGGRGISMDVSAQGRFAAWSEGLMLWRSSPLFGVGFQNFLDYNDKTAHNSFVLCFAELGFVGYFCWMALLVLTILALSALSRLPVQEGMDRDLQRWAGALQLALYGFLAAALFLSRTYMMILYLLLAMAVALAEMARRAGKPTTIPRAKVWVPGVASLSLASIPFFHLLLKANLLWKT